MAMRINLTGIARRAWFKCADVAAFGANGSVTRRSLPLSGTMVSVTSKLGIFRIA